MEQNEVSEQEVRFYTVLTTDPHVWKTSKDLAKASNIAERTARSYVKKFVSLGLCDLAEVFPAHRYRFSEKADKRNKAYLVRLEQAKKVFAI